MQRAFLLAVWMGCTLALGAPAAEPSAAAPKPARPHIVLLISDDDDYEHFGFMGNRRVRTPTLDRLVREGTLLTTAHVAAPLCRPSLASILSGRLPHQNGIYANYLEKPGIGADRTKLAAAGSLPNLLKAAGYSTYLCECKYWEGDPREMGFTHGKADVSWKGFLKFVRGGQDDLFQYIDEQHAKGPMFIWWAPMIPHLPHNPPEKYLKLFENAEIPIPPYYKGDRDEYVAAMRKFYAMGTWFDDGVAQLIDKLKQVGALENTMFVFYVDNGFACGTLAKNTPYEKGLRTPMFVTWPGRVPAGKRIDGLTRTVDLYATMLDYAGIQPPPGVESQSLRPLIEGQTQKTRDVLCGAVFSHAPCNWQGDPAVPRSPERDVYALYARTERWKYIRYTQNVDPGNQKYIWMVTHLCQMPRQRAGDEQLFDLKADPYEMHNLAERPEHREQLAALRKQALDWWQASGGRPLKVAAQ